MIFQKHQTQQDFHQTYQVTCKDIILQWILANPKLNTNELVIFNHNIENELKEYAALFYNKNHNSGTWTRAFRSFKAKQESFTKYGYKLKEVSGDTKEKGWKVVPTKSFS